MKGTALHRVATAVVLLWCTVPAACMEHALPSAPAELTVAGPPQEVAAVVHGSALLTPIEDVLVRVMPGLPGGASRERLRHGLSALLDALASGDACGAQRARAGVEAALVAMGDHTDDHGADTDALLLAMVPLGEALAPLDASSELTSCARR